MYAGEKREFAPSKLPAKQLSELLDCLLGVKREPPLTKSKALRRLAKAASLSNDSPKHSTSLAVAASILADLCEQNWSVDVETSESSSTKVMLLPPSAKPQTGEDVDIVKKRIRRGLMVASNRQLATPAVLKFIKSMERDRVFKGSVVSIRSLFEDGEEFIQRIGDDDNADDNKMLERLSKQISPYVQICEPNARCKKTGLKLLDIWRYCRSTWSLEYNPTPGRTLRILIRNKASKNHTIIGIAMLASPAANYYVRDHWIGWRLDDVIEKLVSEEWKPEAVSKVLINNINQCIEDIRSDDLVEPSEIEYPTEATLFKLEKIRFEAHSFRREDLVGRVSRSAEASDESKIDIRDYDKADINAEGWRALSSSALFTKKRAEQMLGLLKNKIFLREYGFEENPGLALLEALTTKSGREAISFSLNELRKRKLASEISDVSVCGAMPPYNELLGGKLVALLMASREVQRAYKKRYENQVSEISSQMSGKEVTRPADLRLLTTTSLYGVSSSQYNRLTLRAGVVPELKNDVRWIELDKTRGTTVTHLSKLTLKYMKSLATLEFGTRRINSVFGEGSSPRTRQAREGLNLIGVNGDYVLEQGLSRRVFVAEVYRDSRNDLHGFSKVPRKRIGEHAAAISKAWLKRWVINRVRRKESRAKISLIKSTKVSSDLEERIKLANAEGEQD